MPLKPDDPDFLLWDSTVARQINYYTNALAEDISSLNLNCAQMSPAPASICT